ncbi:reverse transcriptase domain-containing protein [Tanacetum coccineum]
MRTRSSSNLIVESSAIPKRRNRRRSMQIVEPKIRTIVETPVVTMADQHTMAELLQAPTEGYGDATVIPAILAENFELKHGLLNLVTSKQFYGFEKEDPHAHIRWFNKITSTIKYRDFEETFSEAWNRFKDLLRACPHHDFTELHQLDTFYNALTPTDQDSLNAAAGGNLLTKTTRDALTIIKNKSKVRNSRNKPVVTKVSTNAPSYSTPHFPEIAALADVVKAMPLQKYSPPASVKAVEEICVTCSGPHPYHQCLATDGNVFPEYRDNIQGYVSAAAVNYNQGDTRYRPQSVANQIRPPGFAQPNVQNNQTRYNQGYRQNRGNNQGNSNYQAPIQQTQVAPLNELSNYKKINDANMKGMQNQINNVKNELRNENQTSIQTSMSNQTNDLKNMMASFFQINTASSSGSGSLPSNTVANLRGDLKAITTRSGVSYDGPPNPPLPKVVERVPEVTKDTVQPRTENIQPLKCSDFWISFLDSSKSGNPTPSLDPILSTSFPSLTPFEGGDFILEEIEACLTNDSIPPGIDDADFDPEGDLILLEKLLNDDPSSPLPPKELHFEEIKTIKSSIDDPPELELKDLSSHLEYVHVPKEKCHFMVKEGIVLGHKISKSGIEVDKAKVDVIAKLPHPTSVKRVRTFNILKKKLTKAPILVALDWDLPFEIMCDASDYAVGAVLGQQLLAVVYAFEKFRPYLVLSKTIVYTDHSALKYLFAKQDAKPRLLRWILILQEFDVIIRDKKGAENLAADHLSRLENPHQGDLEKKEITETFPLETLGMISFHGDSSTP